MSSESEPTKDVPIGDDMPVDVHEVTFETINVLLLGIDKKLDKVLLMLEDSESEDELADTDDEDFVVEDKEPPKKRPRITPVPYRPPYSSLSSSPGQLKPYGASRVNTYARPYASGLARASGLNRSFRPAYPAAKK